MLVAAVPPAGCFLWQLIRQLAPGVRTRLSVFAPPPPGPYADFPEDVVRELFQAAMQQDR
jgi:hypothetical protein